MNWETILKARDWSRDLDTGRMGDPEPSLLEAGDWKAIVAQLEEHNPEAAKKLQEALDNQNTGSGKKKYTPESWEIEEAKALSIPVDAYVDISDEAEKLAEDSTPDSMSEVSYIHIMQSKETKKIELFFDKELGVDMGYQEVDTYNLDGVIDYWKEASYEWFFTKQLEKYKSTGEKGKE